MLDITETDPEYMLRWEKIDYPDILKPVSIPNRSDQVQEIINSAPGFQSVRVINNMNNEKLNYFKKKYNLQSGIILFF